MKHRFSTVVWMVIVALTAFGLYMVKLRAQEQARELAKMERDVKRERDAIHMLQAEWAYLNRPDRLRKLADQYLQSEPLDARRIVDIAQLPAKPPVEVAEGNGLPITPVSIQGGAR